MITTILVVILRLINMYLTLKLDKINKKSSCVLFY